MTKAPTPTEKSKTQRDNIKTPPKTSTYTTITDRSVKVTIAIQLVWLNQFTDSQPSHLPQKPCNQKDVKMYMSTDEHCWKKNSGTQLARTNNLWIPSQKALPTELRL